MIIRSRSYRWADDIYSLSAELCPGKLAGPMRFLVESQPHGILPGDYYRRSQGEKDLIWAFASYEAEQKNGGRCLRVPPKTRHISGLSQKKREWLQSLIYDPCLFD